MLQGEEDEFRQSSDEDAEDDNVDGGRQSAPVHSSAQVTGVLRGRRAAICKAAERYCEDGTDIFQRHYGIGMPGAIRGGSARLNECIVVTGNVHGRIQVRGYTLGSMLPVTFPGAFVEPYTGVSLQTPWRRDFTLHAWQVPVVPLAA